MFPLISTPAYNSCTWWTIFVYVGTISLDFTWQLSQHFSLTFITCAPVRLCKYTALAIIKHVTKRRGHNRLIDRGRPPEMQSLQWRAVNWVAHPIECWFLKQVVHMCFSWRLDYNVMCMTVVMTFLHRQFLNVMVFVISMPVMKLCKETKGAFIFASASRSDLLPRRV